MTNIRLYPVKRTIFHVVRNPCGQYWKASQDFPVGTVNIDALQRHLLQELKQEFEDPTECLSINFTHQVVCGELCKFEGNRR